MSNELPFELPQEKVISILSFDDDDGNMVFEYDDSLDESVEPGTYYILTPKTSADLRGKKENKLESVAIEIIVDIETSIDEFLSELTAMREEFIEIWTKRRDEYISEAYKN